jgi:eukaryotic-like serine/threonine-protein kinase
MSSHQQRTRAPSEPGLPQVFGRYLLVQCLSRGGMGEIFLAKHGLSGFEKLCVIKKVLPHLSEDVQFISRFIDEAQVAIKLQHANIAQVFEVGRVEDEYFLSIEYVAGRDLRRIMAALGERGTRLSVDLALLIAREVASGLAYAHRRTDDRGASLRLVHCDISPPNVMISFEGEVKIIDFGIAKSALRATATDPRIGFGKFGYMAPEQLIRGGTVDYRTDIYAAGVVLYELLTGERLYELGESPDYKALARMVTKGQHPLPSHRDRALAPYDELVARALRPNPHDRYQTAAELRDAIQEALVAINPTISSDTLGEHMSSLFAGEMAEQQRLSARVEATDLRAWAEQLTTQSATTVSYALANLPLVAPQTELVDRVVMAPVAQRQRRSRRRPLVVAAAAAVMLVVGGSVLAWVLGRDGPAPAGAAEQERFAVADGIDEPTGATAPAAEPGGAPQISPLSGEPDEAEGRAAAEERAATEERAAAEERAVAEEAAPPARTRSAPARSARRPAAPPSPPAATAELAADDVHAKFRAVSREYRTFKESYGSRLEGEWADLATYAQFASSPDKLRTLNRKIDQFRARMREARR